MELHPFLELDTRPNAGWWYVMTTAGDCPSLRVGHTAVYVRGKAPGDAGRVYVIGGANPSGPFGEAHVLDLNTRTWDTVDCPGLRPRYEHAAFVPACHPDRIYVFGGANQAGNMNDVQVLDTAAGSWSTLTPSASGAAPSPRTHHTTAAVGDKLIVYSGGHTGADPVGDRQVHCFDASTEAWSVLTVRGDSPKPRHGHAMAAVGVKVFLHGGMAGSTFYDDLHVLDLERNTWVSVKRKRTSPCARAAHAMVACGSDVFVFGGMNREGALDDLHKLDTSQFVLSLSLCVFLCIFVSTSQFVLSFSLSASFSVSLFVSGSLSLSVSVPLSVCLSLFLSGSLSSSVSFPLCLSHSVSVCLSVSLPLRSAQGCEDSMMQSLSLG